MKKAVILSSYEFMKKFNTEGKAIRFFEKKRWNGITKCPDCSSKRIARKTKPYYRCKDCRLVFTFRTNTIMHKSKIEPTKWLYAMYLLQTSRKGISSVQLSKQIGVTQKTAWFMAHRIRQACKDKGVKLKGQVEIDETFFGGLEKNKHKSKIDKVKSWKHSKTMVQGFKSKDGLKTKVIDKATKQTLQDNIIDNVEAGSKVIADEAAYYHTMNSRFNHSSVHHATSEYVNKQGDSTNSIESVWALMKRGHKGVYHKWSKKHIHRYLDEFAFRLSDGSCVNGTMDRVGSLCENIPNNRLTYKNLIG